MSIDPTIHQNNNFYNIADRYYGRNTEWTKPIKALLKDPDAIISFNELAAVNPASSREIKELTWTVSSGTDLYSPSIKTHFYDRLVHILKCIFSSSYTRRFYQAASRLNEVMIQHHQSVQKKDLERQQFINQMAPKKMAADQKIHATGEEISQLNNILNEKTKMLQKAEAELTSYCDDQRIVRPSIAKKDLKEEEKKIFQNISAEEVSQLESLESAQEVMETKLATLETTIHKQQEILNLRRDEIADLSSNVQRGFSASVLNIGALISSQKQAERDANEAFKQVIENKKFQVRQLEQGLEELEQKITTTQSDLEKNKVQREVLYQKLPEEYHPLKMKGIQAYLAANAKAIEIHEADLLKNDPAYSKIALEIQTLEGRISAIESDIKKSQALLQEQQESGHLLKDEIDIFYANETVTDKQKEEIESFIAKQKVSGKK